MKNVVIIGAGPAGLSCAYEILKNNKNIKVTIFEEEEMVGGISKTVNYKGNRIDIFMESEAKCNEWGVKNITIYMLK